MKYTYTLTCILMATFVSGEVTRRDWRTIHPLACRPPKDFNTCSMKHVRGSFFAAIYKRCVLVINRTVCVGDTIHCLYSCRLMFLDFTLRWREVTFITTYSSQQRLPRTMYVNGDNTIQVNECTWRSVPSVLFTVPKRCCVLAPRRAEDIYYFWWRYIRLKL